MRPRPIVFLAICLLAAATAAPQALPPKETIPADFSSDLRSLVEGLYSSSAEQRANSAGDLGNMGERAAGAVPYLAALLGDREKATVGDLLKITAPVSWHAANALGRIGPASTDVLVAVLTDKSKGSDTRSDAAWGLAQSADRRAVEPLLAAAGDPDAGVRAEAAHALRAIADPATLTVLVALLSDESSSARFYAAGALGRINDPRAATACVHALGDPEEKVRAQARGSLTALGTLSVDPLIAALGDSSQLIRDEASKLLRTITKKKFGTDQDKWRRWWEQNRN